MLLNYFYEYAILFHFNFWKLTGRAHWAWKGGSTISDKWGSHLACQPTIAIAARPSYREMHSVFFGPFLSGCFFSAKWSRSKSRSRKTTFSTIFDDTKVSLDARVGRSWTQNQIILFWIGGCSLLQRWGFWVSEGSIGTLQRALMPQNG
jgi:hypothetical protein